jgi:ferredoxin
VLLRARVPLYNGVARALNCRGFGTCGTCAVHVEGEVSPLSSAENVRLNLPPHHLEPGLRLACQCTVLGDVTVRKHAGIWGQRSEPLR